MSRARYACASVLAISAVVSVGSGACSSSSSDAGAAAAPAVVRPDAGQCTRACCDLPLPGAACDADAGSTCTYAVTCPEGLVLSRVVGCQSNVWASLNDCPQAGGSDARGCPAAQPLPGTPCSLDAGVFSCSYTKKCMQQICDGSDCATVRSSAAASCVQGVWQTMTLGPC